MSSTSSRTRSSEEIERRENRTSTVPHFCLRLAEVGFLSRSRYSAQFLLPRKLFGFADHRLQAHADSVRPEGLVGGIETEGLKQLDHIFRGAGAQQVQIKRLKALVQALPLRVQALRQQFAKGIPIDIKRPMEVRDIRPQVVGVFIVEDLALRAVELLRRSQPQRVEFGD